MISLFLMIAYIVVLIVQIICLIKTIKKDNMRYWLYLCGFEIGAIVAVTGVMFYYESLPVVGFMPYLGEFLLCFGAIIVYAVMLFVTVCCKVVIFERKQRRKGVKSASPVKMVAAVVCIAAGIVFWSLELVENRDMHAGKGTVIGFIEEEAVYFQDGNRNVVIENRPVIRYVVNGNEYEGTGYADNVNAGDEVNIYYMQISGEQEAYRIVYPTNNKYFYIPLFALGLVIVGLRFGKKDEKTAN